MTTLRFIGTDGSMGLVYGRKYKVRVYSDSTYIWVEWNNGRCPYSSPINFAKNWGSVNEIY